MTDSTDFITKLGRLLGTDHDETVEKIEGLSVDAVMDVLDAVSRDDAEAVQRAFANETDNDTNEDDTDAEKDVESDADEPQINSLFSKPEVTNKVEDQPKKRAMTDEDAIADKKERFYPNIGDTVMVGEKEGVVKMPHGPKDTVGVMIDGRMSMVKRSEVRPLEEGVLGMTMMPDLRRMQELAGITTSSVEAQAAPMATVSVEPTPDAATVNMASSEAPVAAPEPVASDSDCMAAIMASFDEIEKAIPDLKIKDAKGVRARLNQIMMRLNESRSSR